MNAARTGRHRRFFPYRPTVRREITPFRLLYVRQIDKTIDTNSGARQAASATDATNSQGPCARCHPGRPGILTHFNRSSPFSRVEASIPRHGYERMRRTPEPAIPLTHDHCFTGLYPTRSLDRLAQEHSSRPNLSLLCRGEVLTRKRLLWGRPPGGAPSPRPNHRQFESGTIRDYRWTSGGFLCFIPSPVRKMMRETSLPPTPCRLDRALSTGGPRAAIRLMQPAAPRRPG